MPFISESRLQVWVSVRGPGGVQAVCSVWCCGVQPSARALCCGAADTECKSPRPRSINGARLALLMASTDQRCGSLRHEPAARLNSVPCHRYGVVTEGSFGLNAVLERILHGDHNAVCGCNLDWLSSGALCLF